MYNIKKSAFFLFVYYNPKNFYLYVRRKNMTTPRAPAKPAESKNTHASKLCAKLSESANKVVVFLESKLQKTGSYGDDAKDIACYFKSPMMFLAANKPHAAAADLN